MDGFREKGYGSGGGRIEGWVIHGRRFTGSWASRFKFGCTENPSRFLRRDNYEIKSYK